MKHQKLSQHTKNIAALGTPQLVSKKTKTLNDNREKTIAQLKQKTSVANTNEVNMDSVVQRKPIKKLALNNVAQLKCKHCGAGSHNSNCCPKNKPPVQEVELTDEQLRAEAARRYERMAGTHHEKTGVKGTPKERHQKWEDEGKEDIYQKLKEGQDKKKKKVADSTPIFFPKGPPPPPPPPGGMGIKV